MMRKLLLLIVLIGAATLIAQEYPEVSIRDFNYSEADSLLHYGGLLDEPPQPMLGDTIIVTGIVMNQPHLGADPDSAVNLSAGATACYFQDTAGAEWGGVLLRDLNANSDFAILDTGLVIKVTGVVVAYYTTTELDIIAGSFDASNIIDQRVMPKPVPLTLDSFYVSTPSNPNFLAEKWEGSYVEFRDVTVVESNAMGNGTFTFMDENGYIMLSYNKAYHYRYGTFTSPLPGTKINRIRGFMETRQQEGFGWFGINPINPDDIEIGEVSPPVISNVLRDKSYAGFGEEVVISADVVDADASADITDVKLFYAVNDTVYTEIDMTLVDAENGTHNATIPAQNDSSLIRYYIKASDTDNADSYSPGAGSDNPYYYYQYNKSF